LVPTASTTSAVTVLPTDYVTKDCASIGRLAVLELSDGQAFWTAFPKAGKAPELATLDSPVVAVVYSNGWPGHVLPKPGTVPSTLSPGTWDVCVEALDDSKTLGGTSWLVYGDIPWAGSLVAHP
jgi:hypothetical protein